MPSKSFLFVCFFLIIVIIIGLFFRTSHFFDSELLRFKGEVVEIEGKVKEIEKDKIILRYEKENVLIYHSQEFNYGDELRVIGKIEEPPVFEGFDYKSYLAKQKIFTLIRESEIEKLSEKRFSIYRFRQRLAGIIDNSYPSEESSLLKAMTLGIKSDISDNLKDKLNKSGIRHLTAISGMHTIILINALMFLLLGIGLWRKQAFVLTLVFIILFVVLTGFQPSTIRASIMASMLLLAQAIGRLGDPIRAIILTALVMLGINPLLIVDIGFQLSFLAVLGINYLFPIFSLYFKKFPLKNILIMTLSAQIFTLPILIYNFGYVSLIAPITNLLVLPILAFVLIFGALSALLGLISSALALIFVFPTYFLLWYLIKVSEIFSSFTFSSISFEISFLLCLIYYFVLGYFVWRWKKKHRFSVLGPLL